MGFNDRENSWQCGKKIAYDLCRDWATDSCDADHGQKGAGHARTGVSGYGDSLTTVKLRNYDSVNQPAALLFKDWDCHGVMGRLYAPN